MRAGGEREGEGQAEQPLLELAMPLATFLAEWKNCDRLASYLARMASVSRPDPLLYTNLLSSALNEVFETVFRTVDLTTGNLACTISHHAGTDRIAISFRCGRGARSFFAEALTLSRQPNVEALYIEALLTDGPISPFAGLLELIVDYGARFSTTETKDTLHLVLDLDLDQV